MCVLVRLFVYMHVCVCVVCVCVYVGMCLCVYVSVYVCACVCVCVCVHVYVCTCIHIYIFIFTHKSTFPNYTINLGHPEDRLPPPSDPWTNQANKVTSRMTYHTRRPRSCRLQKILKWLHLTVSRYRVMVGYTLISIYIFYFKVGSLVKGIQIRTRILH